MMGKNFAKAIVVSLALSFLSVLPSAALTAPTGVTEEPTSPLNTTLSSASAKITWPSVSGAVAYSVVARSGGVSIAGSPPACNANECVSLLANLTGGQDYSVTIVAVDSDGAYSESSPVSHRAISSPDGPTAMAVSAGSGSLTFSWLEPNNLGGLPLLGYQILSPNNTITTLSATASSFVASGLNNGTQYVFTIRARNANGLSSPMSFSPATPVGVPATPGRPTVTSTSDAITATWNAPSNGGQDITGYTVRLLINGTVTSSAVLGPAARSHTFNGLSDGNYSVRVIATNPLGDSTPSTPSSTVTFGTAPQSQQISFSPIADQELATGTLQLNVTATSNLDVALAASGQCTVNSQTQVVTFTAAGTCTITATQAGGSGYLAATAVPQTFTITSTPAGSTPPAAGSAPAPVVSSFTTVSNLVSESATVTITGTNLNSVVSVQLGSVVGRIAQQSDTSLTAVFSPVEPGTYSLVVVAGAQRQTFSNAVVIRGLSESTSSATTTSSSTVSPENSNQKITIGTFKGFVAIYFKGHEGARVSIKIAGKWQVVPRVPKDFHRVVRKTGAGYTVKAEVYINRKLVQERLLTTR
jgi:hypothetical protein